MRSDSFVDVEPTEFFYSIRSMGGLRINEPQWDTAILDPTSGILERGFGSAAWSSVASFRKVDQLEIGDGQWQSLYRIIDLIDGWQWDASYAGNMFDGSSFTHRIAFPDGRRLETWIYGGNFAAPVGYQAFHEAISVIVSEDDGDERLQQLVALTPLYCDLLALAWRLGIPEQERDQGYIGKLACAVADVAEYGLARPWRSARNLESNWSVIDQMLPLAARDQIRATAEAMQAITV